MSYSALATLTGGPLPLVHYNTVVNDVNYAIARPYIYKLYELDYSNAATGNWYSITSFSETITPEVAGRPILVEVSLWYSVNAGGLAYFRVLANGAAVMQQIGSVTYAASTAYVQTWIGLYVPGSVAAQTLQVQEYHSAGTFVSQGATGNKSMMIAREI